MAETVVNAQLSRPMAALLKPARYKVFWGGRGAGKSHGVALYLLAQAAATPLRILCCREFQSSMRDSVHRLLVDVILRLGLEDKFNVQVNGIRGVNGSEFIFEGLRHNITRIRSLEGIDKVWVEEAQTVSNASWETLIPTIRKDGSEIILTFNPELETDATYERFVKHPPPNAAVVKLNYHDNPWFPSVLKDEMEHLKRVDPDAYQHIWLGECRLTLDGAIYARELREATEQGRIATVHYDTTKPVSVYVDLGWQDLTAIWFIQHIAGEVRCIDYHEDSQRPFGDYLKLMQAKPYLYTTLWLPHDAQAKSLGTGRSIEELARAAGWHVRIVPKLSVADGINAVRTLFPNMWFDRDACGDGVQALRHYRYELDLNGQFSRSPLHDAASHGADALRYAAVAMQEAARASYPKAPPPKRLVIEPRQRANTNWMRL
jgi:phage terminase large subunit